MAQDNTEFSASVPLDALSAITKSEDSSEGTRAILAAIQNDHDYYQKLIIDEAFDPAASEVPSDQVEAKADSDENQAFKEEEIAAASDEDQAVEDEAGAMDSDEEEGEIPVPVETFAQKAAREFREKGTPIFWMLKAQDPDFRFFFTIEVEDWVNYDQIRNNETWSQMLQVFRTFIAAMAPEAGVPPEREGGFSAAVREWLVPNGLSTLLLRHLLGMGQFRPDTEEYFSADLREEYGLPAAPEFADYDTRQTYGIALRQELRDAKRKAELIAECENNPGHVVVERFNLEAYLLRMADKLLPKQKWAGPGRPPGSGHHQRIAAVAKMLGLPMPPREKLIRHRHVSVKSACSESSSRYHDSKPADTETSSDSSPYNPLGVFEDAAEETNDVQEEVPEQEEDNKPLKIVLKGSHTARQRAKRSHLVEETEEPETGRETRSRSAAKSKEPVVAPKPGPRSKKQRQLDYDIPRVEVADVASSVTPPPGILDRLPGFADAVNAAGEAGRLFYKRATGPRLFEHEFEPNGFISQYFSFKPHVAFSVPPEPIQVADEPAFVYTPITDVQGSDFEPIPLVAFDATTAYPIPSTALLNRMVCFVPSAGLQTASNKLAFWINQRRVEVGPCEAYTFWEPLGIPDSERGRFLRPDEPLCDLSGTRPVKYLPPGVFVPPSLRTPQELLDRNNEVFATTGAGNVNFSRETLTAISKLYNAAHAFVPVSLLGASIVDHHVSQIDNGWLTSKYDYTAMLDNANFKEIYEGVYFGSTKLPDELLGVTSEKNVVSDGVCLGYVVRNFPSCKDISHIQFSSPLTEPGQRRIILDLNNSFSAASLLPLRHPSRRNHVSILAIGAHLCLGWRRTLPGFNANVLSHSGAVAVFVVKAKHIELFTKEALKCVASKQPDFNVCPSILFHGKLKINPNVFVKAGVPMGFTVLRKGQMLSIPINGLYLLYALTTSAFEVWQHLSVEGLAYFSDDLPACVCVPPSAECATFNDVMVAARRQFFLKPNLLTLPECLCGLHDTAICNYQEFVDHMNTMHLPLEIYDGLGHKY